MKNIFFILLFLYSAIAFSQSDKLPADRTTNWNNAEIRGKIPVLSTEYKVNINDFYAQSDSGYFDHALQKIESLKIMYQRRIIYFPKGIYRFSKPISMRHNTILQGDGSDKTQIIFNLKNEKSNCIDFIGNAVKTEIYNSSIEQNADQIVLENELNFREGFLLQIIQGKDEYGNSSSGKEKAFRNGQILEINSVNGKVIELSDHIRLPFNETDKWGEPLKIRIIDPIKYSGIQNLSINRDDRPPKNGGAIINFNLAAYCWVSGVESKIAANNHVSISNSYKAEVRGSYFHDAYSTGGGGNGYGVVLSGTSSNCLIEDKIFEGLRHAMIIAGGANGNVFGYNSSFYKPLINIDEASISVHGHYPYLNLFESNYVEYINVDYVWGANGPFNTFFRNWVYDKGIFGLFRNQELRVEKGTNSTNIIANYANVYASGNDNFSIGNYSYDEKSDKQNYPAISLYYNAKPHFISNAYSFPCFGPNAGEIKVKNKIPSMDRFYLEKKTVDAAVKKIQEKNIPEKIEQFNK